MASAKSGRKRRRKAILAKAAVAAPRERGAERRPWKLDDRDYPFLVAVGTDGEHAFEVVKRSRFRSFAYTKWQESTMVERLGWRCFMTGVQCYSVPPEIQDGNGPLVIPWALTLDHLVCTRMGEAPAVDERRHRHSNLVTCGYAVNAQLGHVPLALKLLHRQAIARVDFDREAHTIATYRTVRRSIIDVEEALMVDGLFPWQPWTYPDGTPGHRAALALKAEMDAFDDAFLDLPHRERAAFMEAFEWRW